MKESVKPVKAFTTSQSPSDLPQNSTIQHNPDLEEDEVQNDDDDDDDAVLDEILEAERQGYGEYQDDYDDINSQDGKYDDEDVASDDDSDNDEEDSFFFGKRKVSDSHLQTKSTKKSKS
jgi:hypothetical protein